MRLALARILAAALLTLSTTAALAHPGSGIALDRRGNLYFIDTGAGVWRLDPGGKLERYGGPAFHWMALDLDDRFASTRLPSSANAEMRTTGRDPGVVLSSDYPVAIGGDGALYYAQPDAAYRLSLVRIDAAGERSVKVRLPETTAAGPLRWLNGLAAGADGSLLFTDDTAIHRVAKDGRLSTVVSVGKIAGCVAPPGYDAKQGPYLRDVTETSDGTIWVAANGCSALLRVPKSGAIEVALRAESPWSPTAVAVGPAGVYVLEYLHTPGDDRRVWVPRVRRLAADGRAETLVTVRRDK